MRNLGRGWREAGLRKVEEWAGGGVRGIVMAGERGRLLVGGDILVLGC